MPYTGSSAAHTAAVDAGRRTRLAVYSVCASAVQKMPSSSILPIVRASTGPPRPPCHRTTGSTHSAAIAFCHSAISEDQRSGASLRVRTVRSANVKPDSTPHARPRTVWLAQVNSGTSSTSPSATSPAPASLPRVIGTPSIARSSNGTNSGKLA